MVEIQKSPSRSRRHPRESTARTSRYAPSRRGREPAVATHTLLPERVATRPRGDVVLDERPLNPTGKIDRVGLSKWLRAPQLAAETSAWTERSRPPPRSAAERSHRNTSPRFRVVPCGRPREAVFTQHARRRSFLRRCAQSQGTPARRPGEEIRRPRGDAPALTDGDRSRRVDHPSPAG